MSFWTIEPIWAGKTVVILGNGPSLARSLPELKALDYRLPQCWKVIAINDGIMLAPWADAIYVCDDHWFGGLKYREWDKPLANGKTRRAMLAEFKGHKFTLDNLHRQRESRDLKCLRNCGWSPVGGSAGIAPQPDGLYSGRNSGYQTIQLAAKAGAARIVLLGFDMKAVDGNTHWHRSYPRELNPGSLSNTMLPAFPFLVKPLAERNISIINCTPDSALTCFPMAAIADALGAEPVAA